MTHLSLVLDADSMTENGIVDIARVIDRAIETLPCISPTVPRVRSIRLAENRLKAVASALSACIQDRMAFRCVPGPRIVANSRSRKAASNPLEMIWAPTTGRGIDKALTHFLM